MTAAWPGSIQIVNNSFEIPVIDPNENPFMAIPVAPFWIELDNDEDYSANTGTFLNPPPDSPAGDHILNADGAQLAFLGSQEGNGFQQELSAVFQAGRSYQLTVAVCPSMRYPPKTTPPMDTLTLAFYAPNASDANDIVTALVPATELTPNFLNEFSLNLPTVQAGDPWAGKTIGIAIRATGTAGAFWDLDRVRLNESEAAPDFTDDSFVNLKDFAVMASEWLSCTGVTVDQTGDGCVDLEDVIVLAGYWLHNV